MIFYLTLLELNNSVTKNDIKELSVLLANRVPTKDIIGHIAKVSGCEEMAVEDSLTFNAITPYDTQASTLKGYSSLFDIREDHIKDLRGNKHFEGKFIYYLNMSITEFKYATFEMIKSSFTDAINDLKTFKKGSKNNDFLNRVTSLTMSEDDSEIVQKLKTFMGDDFKMFFNDLIEAHIAFKKKRFHEKDVFYSFLEAAINTSYDEYIKKLGKRYGTTMIKFSPTTQQKAYQYKTDLDREMKNVLQDLNYSLLNKDRQQELVNSLTLALTFRQTSGKTPLLNLDMENSTVDEFKSKVTSRTDFKGMFNQTHLYNSYFSAIKLLLFLDDCGLKPWVLPIPIFYIQKSVELFDNLYEVIKYGKAYYNIASLYKSSSTELGIDFYDLTPYKTDTEIEKSSLVHFNNTLNFVADTIEPEKVSKSNSSYLKNLTLYSMVNVTDIDLMTLIKDIVTSNKKSWLYESFDYYPSLGKHLKVDSSDIASIIHRYFDLSNVLAKLYVVEEQTNKDFLDNLLYDIFKQAKTPFELAKLLKGRTYVPDATRFPKSYVDDMTKTFAEFSNSEIQILLSLLSENIGKYRATRESIYSISKDLIEYSKYYQKLFMVFIELDLLYNKGSMEEYKENLKSFYNTINALILVSNEINENGMTDVTVTIDKRVACIKDSSILTSIQEILYKQTIDNRHSLSFNLLSDATKILKTVIDVCRKARPEEFFDVEENDLMATVDIYFSLGDETYKKVKYNNLETNLYFFTTSVNRVVKPLIKNISELLTSKRFFYTINDSNEVTQPSPKLIDHLTKSSSFLDYNIDNIEKTALEFEAWLKEENEKLKEKNQYLDFNLNFQFLEYYEIMEDGSSKPLKYYTQTLESITYFLHSNMFFISNVENKIIASERKKRVYDVIPFKRSINDNFESEVYN